MTKEEYKQYNCPMCGFMVRAKTNEEILKHVKCHIADVHGVAEVSPKMAEEIVENIKLVMVYVP